MRDEKEEGEAEGGEEHGGKGGGVVVKYRSLCFDRSALIQVNKNLKKKVDVNSETKYNIDNHNNMNAKTIQLLMVLPTKSSNSALMGALQEHADHPRMAGLKHVRTIFLYANFSVLSRL